MWLHRSDDGPDYVYGRVIADGTELRITPIPTEPVVQAGNLPGPAFGETQGASLADLVRSKRPGTPQRPAGRVPRRENLV